MSERRAAMYRSAALALLAGLIVNTVLAATKIAGGAAGRSFALIADAFNSLGDVLVSIVSLLALRVARRPPSPTHPYGYSRAEAAAASNIALVVLLSALALGIEAVRRLPLRHPLPPVWTLWIAAGNVVVKETIYQYKARVGRELGSRLMEAAAWDHRADALSSLAVLVGLSVVRWLGPRAIYADEVAALVVVAFVVTASASLLWRSFAELLDRQAADAVVDAIRDTAEATDGVAAIEKLRVRKSGLEHFVDIHVQVSPTATVSVAHEIGHRVKDRVLAAHPTVRDALVHLEPFDG